MYVFYALYTVSYVKLHPLFSELLLYYIIMVVVFLVVGVIMCNHAHISPTSDVLYGMKTKEEYMKGIVQVYLYTYYGFSITSPQ